MADWPDLDALKRILDVKQNDFDTDLEGVLDAAIEQVQTDVGEEVEPTESLARAALLLAVRIARAPAEPIRQAALDPDYQRLLKGHRVSFGVG
jgi:hypothetical protein